MENLIAKLLQNIESGKISRRQLMQSAALAAAGSALVAKSFPAAFAQGGGKAFPVTTVNHLSLAVKDYAKARDWYVEVFGMRVVWDDGKKCALEFGSLTEPNGIFIQPLSRPTDKPTVGHFAFGVPTPYFKENKAAMKAEMERRHLENIRPDGEMGWWTKDPAGYTLNTWVTIKDKAMFPGAAFVCEEADSAKCKQGYEEGMKNLSMAPQPSGKGFKALYYSHIVLNVSEADYPKEKEFYTGMYGMKVIYENLKGTNPQIMLRFGKNTLYLRPNAAPGEKPFCNHFAFVVENYNQDTSEAKLKALGLEPKPDSKLAWSITDLDGLRVEVAGPGLPEHIAKDCHGSSISCPGGPKG
ncbi:MAG: hypothetical protein A3G41_06960 [Elusimicrobia bacterium RIFCSPLOWO2_12_FULL_59_9]|nr:MAG: hypothetical protein A3G41_06960 [Elusimicrobia bacterium RIFCSPLOWO2_12_FULL_59_9]